eukprot:3921853-Amphidinium_carterae.1
MVVCKQNIQDKGCTTVPQHSPNEDGRSQDVMERETSWGLCSPCTEEISDTDGQRVETQSSVQFETRMCKICMDAGQDPMEDAG